MKRLKLGFFGFGLIGGSIARSLKKRNVDVSIHVYTRRQNPDLDEGVREGIIDELLYDLDDRLADCDILFLCAPVLTNLDFLSKLGDITESNCILTDVGSVKGNICQKAAELGLSDRFIGGHPMAGSEKTGYASSTDTLLENAFYLLTPGQDTPPEKLELLRHVVTATGAFCVVLSPEKHDMITAAISHVPHIIAVTLVNMVRLHDNDEGNMKAFAAGGFRDITRIASSSPEMWQDICIANRDSIRHFLAFFEEQLKQFRQIITTGEREKIYALFQEARDYRDSIPSKKSSLIARSYELYVNIADRTGAIARVATIFSANNISIKNIGILHNREFADGVLRIELYSEKDAENSRTLLEENGYDIVDRD